MGMKDNILKRLDFSCFCAQHAKVSFRQSKDPPSVESIPVTPAGVEATSAFGLHASGLDSFSRDTPSLLTSVHLVDRTAAAKSVHRHGRQWQTFAATAMPAHDRRFTADWAKDNERRAAGQRAEGQRLADYYARTTKEQEDRDNAEARESFQAQQERLTVNRPLKR
jgi:hypothetical protein